jgi:hypothetical protein
MQTQFFSEKKMLADPNLFTTTWLHYSLTIFVLSQNKKLKYLLQKFGALPFDQKTFSLNPKTIEFYYTWNKGKV